MSLYDETDELVDEAEQGSEEELNRGVVTAARARQIKRFTIAAFALTLIICIWTGLLGIRSLTLLALVALMVNRKGDR